MQNQLQYPNNNHNPNKNGFPQHKYNSPTHFKTQDKTLPTNHIKHFSSNPNLSLDINTLKNSQFTQDTQNNTFKKNMEYRSPPAHNNYTSPTAANHRLNRPQMTQSLIIGDQTGQEVPEEPSTTKKDMFRNMPRKQYRMS